MSINQRIKTLRKKLNLIQQDFAKKIGVQRVTISWMEKEGNTITRHILDRLQRELNLNNAEMEIIKTFIELSPEQRRMGIQFIKDFSSKLNTNFAGVLDIPRASEATTVSHSDTSARPASFPGSDHVAESTAAYHAPADSSARPAGISDDEWQLLQAARREKAQTSGTSDSTSSEENRA